MVDQDYTEPNAEAEGKTFDFDQFWAEKKREPLRVKVLGEWEELPPAMPASVILELMRLEKSGKRNIADVEVIGIGVKLFGDNLVDKWVSKGLDIEQLGKLIEWATTQYTGKSPKKAASKGKR